MLYLELPHLSRKIHNRFDSNHIQLDRLQRTFTHTIVRLDPRDKYSNKKLAKECISSTSVIFSSNLMVAALWKTTPTSETNVLNIFWVEEVPNCGFFTVKHQFSGNLIVCTYPVVHRYSSCNDFGKLGLKETCVSTFWKMVGSRNGKQISCLIVHIL